MTQFLNVPFLPQDDYVKFLNSKSAYIDSVHFSLMGAKRLDNRVDPQSIDHLETIIQLMKQVKVKNKYLLLNSIFYGPDLLIQQDHLAHLIDCLNQCVSAGIVKGIIYCDQFLLQSLSLEAPDLVLLDIMLPKIDGYRILSILKKNSDTKDIPVVMLTSKNRIIDKVKGRLSAASAYLTKPFKPAELIDMVNTIIVKDSARAEHSTENTVN